MPTVDYWNSGWCRDVPSHRDYTQNRPTLRRGLARLPQAAARELPSQADWREYCPPVADQLRLPTSPAHACVAMVQYFERRSTGKLVWPSRLFVHQNGIRISGSHNVSLVSLRATLQGMVRFGFPPERHWPYEEERLGVDPDAFAYGFACALRGCRYLRLDVPSETGEETLNCVKAFLSAGFTCVFGCPLPVQLSDSSELHFPAKADECQNGQALFCVGFDDRRRIRSDRGALLVQNSWGSGWGDHGFAWLPYRYVQHRLAVDFWTLLRSKWLKSDEFSQPLFPSP